MPDNLINISTTPSSNNILPCITHDNSSHNIPDILDRILLIENNPINRENNSHITSPSWSVNNFLSKIKNQFLRKLPSQPAVDIELNNILSQGRRLSQDSDTLHRLLKDKKNIDPSSALSLTTKTGIACGMLLAGSLIGGGVYYSQRTGRGQYHGSRNASDSNLSPASPNPSGTYQPFYSHSPDYIPSTFSERQDTQNKNQIDDELINSKLIPLITGEESGTRKIKRHNVYSPCNYTDINQKKSPRLTYIYLPVQHETCLAESFKQLCQKTHYDARDKQGCFYVPRSLVLNITGHTCMCPPPDWLEMIIFPPLPEFLHLANPPIIYIEPQPATEPTTATSFTPMVTAEINTTQLYTSQSNTVLPKKSSDEPDPFTYENERKNLTLSETLRRISKMLENPGAAVLTAAKTALDQGGVNNTQFYQEAIKVEKAIDNIIMLMPMANRAFITINIVGDILNLYSDSLESKEMDRDTLTELVFQTIILSQDIIFSVTTDDMKKLSNDKDITENKKFLHPFSFEKNNLMMMMDGAKKKIKVDRKFNHLYTPDTNEFIFYDHSYDYGKRWVTDYYKLNDDIENTLQAASKKWRDPENIYFFKNSSPPLYSNGIIIRYHGELHLLINDVFHKIEEIPVKNGIYRYLIKNGDKYTPVTYEKTSWVIEESSSPLVSQKLRVFLDNNHSVKNNLVSKNINHQDVSPLTSYFNIQFDKKHNKYLKINDQYYQIKMPKYGSYYIKGPHDLLELQYIDNQYHLKSSSFDSICCFHKTPIRTFKGTLSDPHFFLDKKIIDDIRHIYSLPENQIKFDLNEMFRTMKDSENIDKAITINDIDYIFSDKKLIRIFSNGDDTYIIGDPSHDDKNILAYKNKFGDTYFKIPKTRKKWQGLIGKSTHCITKRQPAGACAVEYYESHGVGHFLEENSSQSIIINDYDQYLELHDNFDAIYQEKQNGNNLYYKRKDNTFFHVKKELSNISSFTPHIFTIYGKNANQQIDLENDIIKLCVVKDFDTKKIILSTPREAQETIFDIPEKLSDAFLTMNEQNGLHKDITSADLARIKENQSLLDDMTDLKELFYRSGKKIISSIRTIESALDDEISTILKPGVKDKLEINDLKKIEQSKIHPVIEEICNNAFKKTTNYIDNAIATMENSKETLNKYITEQLGISDTRAGKYFASSLKSKLKRMRMFFNENNKENIMIITKKEPGDLNREILSELGEDNLGFTLTNDPLDRIFINTAIVKDFPEHLANPENTPLLKQPETPERNRLFFTNLFSETMLHESVHALGSPDDYLYLNYNKEGSIQNIAKSLEQIENAIATKTMREEEFAHFSKVYFISNPVYRDFSFASLSKPEVQTELFRQDSFFRAMLLLKNPDTITLLVRELANPSQLEVQERPTSSVKKPASSLTRK